MKKQPYLINKLKAEYIQAKENPVNSRAEWKLKQIFNDLNYAVAFGLKELTINWDENEPKNIIDTILIKIEEYGLTIIDRTQYYAIIGGWAND